jgi:hypothetical protein
LSNSCVVVAEIFHGLSVVQVDQHVLQTRAKLVELILHLVLRGELGIGEVLWWLLWMWFVPGCASCGTLVL